MTLYRALAQLGRLLTEFAERELERRNTDPDPLVEQIRIAWGRQQTRRSA
jgi:hypothetical protein